MQIGIVGSGAIGTDLLVKLRRRADLDFVAIAGIDSGSAGLAQARALGVSATDGGLAALLDEHSGIGLVLDATSADAHTLHAELLAKRGVLCIDLTPSGLGPAVVPDVNLCAHRDASEINLVTCGAQATVPVVAAVAAVADVPYAEIVATIASRSAGPGTRANIDEFTTATARALESIGGAREGKALIVLNPAEPPITMRNAIHLVLGPHDRGEVGEAIDAAVTRMQAFVPGYGLDGAPVFGSDRVTVVVTVEGAGDHLPAYAGNLDIMTSAAVRVCEILAAERQLA